MKKILYLLSAILFSVPLYAQEIILDKQNVRTELAAWFQRAEQASIRQTVQQELISLHQNTPNNSPLLPGKPGFIRFSQPAKTSAQTQATSGTPWQIAMFLAATDRPVSETLGILERRIVQGLLRQAVVLDITPLTVSVKKGHRTQTETYPAAFYFLYMEDGKPVRKRAVASSEVSADELLTPMFQHFHKNDDIYSAAIIDGHGSGYDMFYGKDGWLDMEQLLSSLKDARLKLDILNLDSCHMGSFYNLHKLARYQNVSYLVASSDFMMGNSDRMYYTFLNHLNLAPRQAAARTTQSIKNTYRFNSFDRTHNSLAMDLSSLSGPVLEWFKSYGMLMTAGSDELQENMLKPFDPRWGTWRSFSKILRKQIAYLQEHEEDIYWNGYNVPDVTRDFIINGNNLLEALQESTLTQWCYSAQLDAYFVNRIPPNIDCVDGVSVTKNQLNELVKEEQSSLESALEKNSAWYLWR